VFKPVLRAALAALTTALTVAVTMLPGHIPAAGATSPLPAFGVQFHATWGDYTDAQRAEVLDKLAAAHVQWVRIDVGWKALEQTGKGQFSSYQFNLAMNTFTMAQQRGIKVLAELWGTPTWANGGQGQNVPPSNVNDYADIAGYAANYFKGKVNAWEIWNEPNLSGFWSTKDPATYAAMVKAAYPRFKAADPTVPVVAGATANNDTPWLTQFYAAGAKGSFDVLSVHPYQVPTNLGPEVADNGCICTMDHIRTVHDLMVQQGDGAKPIWGTEYGWSAHANTGTESADKIGVTEDQQGDFLQRSLVWFAANHPYVTNVFWYNERQKVTGDPQEDGYGLLRRDLTQRPAYYAAQSILAGNVVTSTVGSTTGSTTTSTSTSNTATSTGPAYGYRLTGRDGRTLAFTTAGTSSTPAVALPSKAVVVGSSTASNGGTWIAASDGSVYAVDGAPFYGSLGGTVLNQPIVSMASTPNGGGYWLVASDGGIFAFGNARFFGSTGSIHLNKPIVGMAPTPDGQGYWLVASDGGIFAYGNAKFYGSTGSLRLNKPIVGMASTPAGDGYWLVGSDGGVFAYGSGRFFGSTGSLRLNAPIVGIVPTHLGDGYWFVARDGGVFAYGTAPFLGSGTSLGEPVTAMAPLP
jgi:hypothetical protein